MHNASHFPEYIFCRKKFIQTKFVFPKEVYSYPIYIKISSVPVHLSLSKDPPFRCATFKTRPFHAVVVMAMKLWMHPTVHTSTAIEKKQ